MLKTYNFRIDYPAPNYNLFKGWNDPDYKRATDEANKIRINLFYTFINKIVALGGTIEVGKSQLNYFDYNHDPSGYYGWKFRIEEEFLEEIKKLKYIDIS